MKKTYIQPEIWVEKLKTESPLLGDSSTNQVTNVKGSDLRYGGSGIGPARAGEKQFWDEEEEDSRWNQL